MKKVISKQYRQGDVLLVAIEQPSKDWKANRSRKWSRHSRAGRDCRRQSRGAASLTSAAGCAPPLEDTLETGAKT